MKPNKTRTISVLIVDDEIEFRELLAELVQRMGFAAITASGGHSALELVRNASFNIALVDYQMPGMNGIDLLKNLRMVTPDTAVIVITGTDDATMRVELKSLGAVAVITKPLNIVFLEKLIRDLVSGPGH